MFQLDLHVTSIMDKMYMYIYMYNVQYTCTVYLNRCVRYMYIVDSWLVSAYLLEASLIN